MVTARFKGKMMFFVVHRFWGSTDAQMLNANVVLQQRSTLSMICTDAYLTADMKTVGVKVCCIWTIKCIHFANVIGFFKKIQLKANSLVKPLFK